MGTTCVEIGCQGGDGGVRNRPMYMIFVSKECMAWPLICSLYIRTINRICTIGNIYVDDCILVSLE